MTTQFTCRQALDEPDLLMPYVFGETEKIKGFNKEKGDILEIAAKFNDTTNSQFDTVTNFSKIKVMWTDSPKDFTKKYFYVQDSNKIMDVIHLTQEGKIDSEKLIKLLKTQQEKIIHNLIKKHTDKERQLPAVLSWKIWFPYDYYIYIFPRMLLINSGIAFFLGFFAQIAFQSAGYKEPI